jgi:hypothetical protein
MRQRVNDFFRALMRLWSMNVAPFREIVLLGLPNGGCCVIRRSAKAMV